MSPTSNEFHLLKVLTLISSSNKSLWRQLLLDIGESLVEAISICARNAQANERLEFRSSWLQDSWFRNLADKNKTADQKALIILNHRSQIQHLLTVCLDYVRNHEAKVASRRSK